MKSVRGVRWYSDIIYRSSFTYDIPKIRDMTRLAELTATAVKEEGKGVLLLSGDFGVGKTAFAREFITAFTGIKGILVNSPTYTIVHRYDFDGKAIHHIDLCRIKTHQELSILGIDDAINNDICLIEWPDRLGALQPKSFISLNISDTYTERTSPNEHRRISIGLEGEQWYKKIEMFKKFR